MTISPQPAVPSEPAPSRSDRHFGHAIGGAALILMLGNLVGSLLGFARQFIIAKVFGDTLGTDAFVAASIVPQMFYDLTIGAAVSAALIPTFTAIFEARGEEELRRVVGGVLGLAWLILAIVVALLVAAAGPMMNVILWGFHTQLRTGALGLSVQIARLLVPTLFFLGTSAVLLSTLYSMRRFTVSAFAPSFYHLGIVGGAIILARPLGILALPVGAVAGSIAQALIQVPTILRNGVWPSIHLSLDPEIRRIVRLYLPVAAGLLVSIVGQVIDISFKSELHSGAITAMYWATVLTQFPIGIAVAAMSFAVLPSISADAAAGRVETFKDTLGTGMRLVLFMTIPATIGYLALATPIVSLIFQHGRFHPVATARTVAALTGYAIQIPFVGIDQLLIFSFYARRDTVTPMLVGVGGVIAYVVFALLLMPRFQIFGLALANTLQNSLHGLVLLGLMFAAFGSLRGRDVVPSAARSLVAAAIMGVGAWTAARLIARQVDTRLLPGQALDALVPILLGTILYVAASRLMGSPELDLAWRTARARLARQS